MLTRHEVETLQAQSRYPSISILAPTHRTAPANKQDRIKVNNLVKKAVGRLHKEFKKREVASVVKNLQELVKQVDWQHTLDGLALFASDSHSASVALPFRVKPQAIIDETYATRDLVYAFNRATPYRVLVLGHTARLYDAWTTVLEEHANPFPMQHQGAGGAAKLPAGEGINRSAVRNEAQRKFFRSVDEALGTQQKAHPLPLVVVGVERNLAFYREVTAHADCIIGMLAGNHEKTSPSTLGKLVWPVFEAGAIVRRTDALVQLDDAVSANRYASGIDQVWTAVKSGKCRFLLVEKDFHYPADVSPAGDRLLPFTGRGAQALDDVVDEVVERALKTGAEVFFYPPDDLEVHQKIAVVLRK